MSATIVRNAVLHLNYAGPIAVDLSCYCIAFELTGDVEILDIGTFCKPSASALGRTTYSSTATLLWEPALYSALQAHLGEACLLSFAPDASKPTEYIKFNTNVSTQPWGRFELGQRAEVEMPLAVLDTPVWTLVGTSIFELTKEGDEAAAAAAEAAPAEEEAA